MQYKKIYKWYSNGKLAKETWDPEGEILSVEYLPNNVTILYYYFTIDDDGVYRISCKEYRQNGSIHRDREEGPAEIYYNQDGSVFSEYYHVRNTLRMTNYIVWVVQQLLIMSMMEV